MILVTVGAMVGLLTVTVLASSVVLQGGRLGALIEKSLPENHGKMEIGGVRWRLRALLDLFTDAPSPVEVDGLRIIDPEGTVVLDVPHLEARVKLRTLIGGSFSIHDLKVGRASWRFAKMKKAEGIGFLAALAPKKPAPVRLDAKGSFFRIVSAELGDLDAAFDFPGSWGLELKNIRAKASLNQSSVDPKHPEFGFIATDLDARGGGYLRILDAYVLPFDRVAINEVSTRPERSDDIFLDLKRAETGKTVLVAKGYFTGIYGETSIPGIDLHAEMANAADALDAVVKRLQLEGVSISGDGARTVIDLKDAFAKLRVTASFSGLDARYGDFPARGVGFQLGYDGGAGLVEVKDLGLGAPEGGRLGMDVRLDTNTLVARADVRLDALRTDAYLPEGVRPLAAGRLSGRIRAEGDIAKKSARLEHLDLRLARQRAGGGLPPTVRVHGDARFAGGKLDTSGISVEVPGASVTAKGQVDLQRELVEAGLSIVAEDLARVLKDVGAPPLARDARLDAKIGGSFTQPKVEGDAAIHGIAMEGRKVPELKARFGLERGTARLEALSGAAFGGRIAAQGTLKLYEKSTRRMLRAPVVDARVEAHGLDLQSLAGVPDVAGRISFDARAEGPLDDLRAAVHVPSGTEVRAFGESATVGPIDVALAGKRLDIRALHVKRALGGTLDVKGQVAIETNDLDVVVTLSKVPLASLPGVREGGVPVSGTVSAKIHVKGRPDRPSVSGEVALAGVSARGVKLGDGRLALSSPEPGTIALRGELLDRFHIDATVALGPAGPSIHGALGFSRLVLEELVPEMVAFGDARGVASGRVQVAIDPGRPLALDVLIDELSLSVAREEQGRNGETTIRRVRIANTQPVHVRMNGDKVALDEARFATEGGELKAEGMLDGEKILGDIVGHLDLEFVQPFMREQLDKLTGGVALELTAGGTVSKPSVRGMVEIRHPIRLKPKTFARDVSIASGVLEFANDHVELKELQVAVEGSRLRLAGRAGLGPGFAPEDIRADLDGNISAHLLTLMAPDAVTEARGRARIRAAVRGTLAKPLVNGRVELGEIDLRVRGTGTRVEVKSGTVQIDNDGLELRDVKMLLDDQGVLLIGASGVRPGRVQFTSLVPFKPGAVDLPLHGERLGYRLPGTAEIDDLQCDFDLRGHIDRGFGLRGEVRLVSGRYLQDFKVQQLVISPRVNESSVRPFYDGQPLLEELGLDLTVRTVGEGFVVQNNIAPEIHVDISLHVGGTLAAPTLGGNIRPTDGRFQIPGMRGEFDLVQNASYITFVPTKSVEDGDTPELNIEAVAQVMDAVGAEHNVRMRISGPLREARIDLSSDGGLDRNQTAMLLLTGRTSTDAQRVGTQNPTVGANISTGADVAGQLTRDTIANLMEPYIDETFRRALGLNLRLTVGPDGFEARVRRRISRRLNFQADALWGFQNRSRQGAQLNLWLLDYISLAGGIERVTLSSQTGVSETLPLAGNLELRWDFPIRL